jgi:outer membrane protein OmpA-like peptidoglycan-associated protein
MNVASLGSLLTAELPHIRSLIPSGLPGLSSLSGLFGSASSTASTASHTAASAAESTGLLALERTKIANRWLWPVVLLGALLIGGLIWYFNRGRQPVNEAANQATAAVSDATKSAVAALGEFFKRKLPNGVELSIPRLGIENKLVTFIEDPSKPVDTTTWFDFDRLLFDTGSATLQPSSSEQLQNVAAILKAYPNVHVKIGGYTDNTGDAAANLQLSSNRASNVMAELVRLGVEPSRLEAQGYGVDHPVADNSTEEGRARNRRISLRVTQK